MQRLRSSNPEHFSFHSVLSCPVHLSSHPVLSIFRRILVHVRPQVQAFESCRLLGLHGFPSCLHSEKRVGLPQQQEQQQNNAMCFDFSTFGMRIRQKIDKLIDKNIDEFNYSYICILATSFRQNFFTLQGLPCYQHLLFSDSKTKCQLAKQHLIFSAQ